MDADDEGEILENSAENTQEEYICQSCRRSFKTERGRKAHERSCQERVDGSPDDALIDEEDGEMEVKGHSENRGSRLLDMDAIKEQLLRERELLEDARSQDQEMREHLIDELSQVRGERHKLESERTKAAELEKEIKEVQRAREEEEIRLLKMARAEWEKERGVSRRDGPGEYAMPEMVEGENGDVLDSYEEEALPPMLETSGDLVDESEMAPLREKIEELANAVRRLEASADSNLAVALTDAEERLGNVEKSVEERFAVLAEEFSTRNDAKGTKRMENDIKKIDERTMDIIEEVGFGESMDVSKIPPNILNIVYQSTLNDVVLRIRAELGAHDSDEVLNATLEDIRTKTSGSELFMIDGGRLKTRNLVKTLEQKLVSAKQIQTTYSEILAKLLEFIPGYKPKNFRAMIKLKSQEYAVDKSTQLVYKTERLSESIKSMNNMIIALQSSVSSIPSQFQESLEERAEKSHVAVLEERIEAMEEKLESIQDGKAPVLEVDDVDGSDDEPVDDSDGEIMESGDSKEEEVKEKASPWASSGVIELGGDDDVAEPEEEDTHDLDEKDTRDDDADDYMKDLDDDESESDDLADGDDEGTEAEEDENSTDEDEEDETLDVDDLASDEEEDDANEDTASGDKEDEPEDETPLVEEDELPEALLDADEDVQMVYSTIPENGATSKRLAREIKTMDEEKVLKALDYLQENEMVSTTKRGRHVIYLRTSQE